MASPYEGLPVSQWKEKTLELIDEHPLDMNELYDVVHQVWEEIFETQIGAGRRQIGKDLFPRPQVMAFFLHEMIPLELTRRYPDSWRREQTSNEKDLVYIPDSNYSVELKTSSSKNRIYGNRSYAQKSTSKKKSKDGYYLAVNFGKFTKTNSRPKIHLVRFGWLDFTDWSGQDKPTGQQAKVTSDARAAKLLTLPLS